MLKIDLIDTPDIKEKLYSDFGNKAEEAITIIRAAVTKYDYINNCRIIRCIIYLSEKKLENLSRIINQAIEEPKDVMLWAEYNNLKDGETPKRVRDFNKTFESCEIDVIVTSQIIFEIEPTSFIKKNLVISLIFISLMLILYFVTHTIFIALILLIVLLLNIVNAELNFDGWSIKNDEIVLLNSGINGIKSKTIKWNAILKISYFAGGYRSSAKLIFQLKNEKVDCDVNQNIFKLADTLKYFQSKGIEVKLIKSDAEIQLYLDGKIESIPMTNRPVGRSLWLRSISQGNSPEIK